MKFSPLLSAVSRTSTLALLFSSVLWLTSCDDDPDPDNVLPELTVTNLADDATVWDVVSISLEASDDRGIDKVEIFVDGSLVTSLTEAPFSADWDTNSLTDGAHTVKVVATDKAGNNVEKDITVTVKNVLMSFTVPENHLWNNEEGSIRGFVFLSDADGKLIKSVEYQNGQHVEIKAPGFKGETFNLTQAVVGIDAEGNYPNLWTFVQVERGAWSLLGGFDEDEDETIAGKATLNYSNGVVGTHYEVTTAGMYSHSFEGDIASSVIDLKKSPVSLYATRFTFDNEGMPKPAFYRMFPNIVVGSNAINLAQINLPLTKLTPAVPTTIDNASMTVYGSLVNNDFTDAYRLGSFYRYTSTDAFVEIYIPGTTFISYYVEADSYKQGTFELTRGTKNINQVNVTPPQYQGNITFANNKIMSSVTGTFDFLTTSFQFSSEVDDVDWIFILPGGANVSVTVPELPEALKNFNVPVVSANPDDFQLYDYEEMTDYNTLKAYMRTSTQGLGGMEDMGREYTWLVSYQNNPGGRTKKSSVTHDLPVGKSALKD